MFKRPSESKVAGVSRRYLSHLEQLEEAKNDLYHFQHEEESIAEAYRIVFSFGWKALATTVKYPIHAYRRSVLWEAQQAEGYKSGEEYISKFALRKCQQPQEYPLLARRIEQ